ncbi:MAG: glycosyltransferase [Deltaproteobacteria bacterium]|nr:glycosyltransferase [Deltaproteobacteria bacterium]
MPDPALPKISLVTPSYNQAAFLEETLRSVLDQGYPRLEYLVMDGGSTDGSVEVIRRHEAGIAHWQSQPDAGQSEALAQGFARSSGEVLGWLNSDDTLEPGALLAVGEAFARHPEVDLVYGNLNFVDAAGRTLFTAYPLLRLGILRYENRFVPQQSMFWRRPLYERVGGVNPSLRFAMDYELLLKFLLAGATTRKIDRVLGSFRVHADAKSSTIRDVMRREWGEILSRFLPDAPGPLGQRLRAAAWRAYRFLREPRSVLCAVRSRTCGVDRAILFG